MSKTLTIEVPWVDRYSVGRPQMFRGHPASPVGRSGQRVEVAPGSTGCGVSTASPPPRCAGRRFACGCRRRYRRARRGPGRRRWPVRCPDGPRRPGSPDRPGSSCRCSVPPDLVLRQGREGGRRRRQVHRRCPGCAGAADGYGDPWSTGGRIWSALSTTSTRTPRWCRFSAISSPM